MPKLILDLMGGDNAPRANLEGAQQALPELEGELVLVGDEAIIRPLLAQRSLRPLAKALKESHSRSRCRVRLVHAAESIDMEDSIRAVRTKPGASINVGCRMAAESWKNWKARNPPLSPHPANPRSATSSLITPDSDTEGPAGFVSAGHSGAMMASALLHMGRITGIERPAIAVKLPTLSPDGCVLLDVGANVDCKPEHLRDFAIMGALFAQVERRSATLPRVGILSNGEERNKGNELTRASLSLIENLPCFDKHGNQAVGEFIGYSEGKEIFKGQVDVVVTDGFVGNVVLKSVEGLGAAVVATLKNEAKYRPLTFLGFLLSAGVFRQLKRKLDYAEYGAAPLLGVAGYSFICHGRSNAKAIKNALLRAQSALFSRFVERLEIAMTDGIAPSAARRPEGMGPDPRPESSG